MLYVSVKNIEIIEISGNSICLNEPLICVESYGNINPVSPFEKCISIYHTVEEEQKYTYFALIGLSGFDKGKTEYHCYNDKYKFVKLRITH